MANKKTTINKVKRQMINWEKTIATYYIDKKLINLYTKSALKMRGTRP